MASIIRDPRGRKTIQFSEGELSGRPKIRLGKTSESIAKSVLVKLQALVSAKRSGMPVDAETATWLSKIDSEFYDKLASLSLVTAKNHNPDVMTLHDLVEKYISSRAGLKDRTLINYRATQRKLEEHFGADHLISSINAGHARDYREWMVKRYADATVSREIKRAKQFFEYAVDCELLLKNPFRTIKAGPQTNSNRKVFVDELTIDAVLDACPNNEWRLIVALARYGGLRIPSELTHLTWDCVDWDKHKIIIHDQKNSRIDGHEVRVIPIFPEIRPHLEKAFNDAAEGSLHIISEPRRRKAANLRTGLIRILRKAGIRPWKKLFHNLRASRQTELVKLVPDHLVCAWLGNSPQVAKHHYLMNLDEDYSKAAGVTPTKDAPSAVQNPVQPVAVRHHHNPSPEKQFPLSPANSRDSNVKVPPRGVEPLFSD